MRSHLACLIFLASFSLSAQSFKLPQKTTTLTTFSCAEEQSLHSPLTQEAATSFKLVNNGKEPIKIFWIQRQGQRKAYNNDQPIEVGGSYSQQTFDGDLWIIADVQGNCLKIFKAHKEADNIETTTIDFKGITNIIVPPVPPSKPSKKNNVDKTVIPPPPPPTPDPWEAQRSKSPFDGPPNQGTPDRLWIWTNKSSTLVNGYVDAEIGLANKLGPNCTSASPITFNLICNNCLIDGSKSHEFQINAGQRVAKTRVQIESTKVGLSAITPKLQSDQVQLKGCPVANQVILGASQKSFFGRADSVTPVPFGLTFLNDSGETATNLKEKTILVSTNGPEITPQTLKAGALMQGSTIKIPPDQCDVELEARSEEAGHFGVNTFYLNNAAKPPVQFTFTYPLGWKDVLALLLAVAIGATTRREVWDRRGHVQRIVAIGVSCAGAIVGFGLAYLAFVRTYTIPAPWLVLGVFGVVGSTLGVRAVLSIFLGRKEQSSIGMEGTKKASAN